MKKTTFEREPVVVNLAITLATFFVREIAKLNRLSKLCFELLNRVSICAVC